MIQTVKDNPIHLEAILKYNVKNNLLFFRISSDLIPFASHPICKFAWHKFFQYELQRIGDYIKKYNIRISMHPNQFIVLNSHNEKTVQNSIRELRYHCKILDEIPEVANHLCDILFAVLLIKLIWRGGITQMNL